MRSIILLVPLEAHTDGYRQAHGYLSDAGDHVGLKEHHCAKSCDEGDEHHGDRA